MPKHMFVAGEETTNVTHLVLEQYGDGVVLVMQREGSADALLRIQDGQISMFDLPDSVLKHYGLQPYQTLSERTEVVLNRRVPEF